MKRALSSLGMGFALRPFGLGLDAGNSAYIINTPTVAASAIIAARDDGTLEPTVGNACSLSATFVDKSLYLAEPAASVCEVCR